MGMMIVSWIRTFTVTQKQLSNQYMSRLVILDKLAHCKNQGFKAQEEAKELAHMVLLGLNIEFALLTNFHSPTKMKI